MVPTAQNLQPLVHSWPAIMKVASPLDQQLWMLGHLASSHTVCNLLSLTLDFVCRKTFCSSPLGREVLNQSGNLLALGVLSWLAILSERGPEEFSPMGWAIIDQSKTIAPKKTGPKIEQGFIYKVFLVTFVSQKIALVTGGAKRIGSEICRLLVSEGWHVIVHYNSSSNEANLLAEELGQQNISKIKANFTLEDEVKNMVEQVLALDLVKTNGGLDLVVHNASIFYPQKSTEFTWSDSETYFAVHHHTPALLNSLLFESLEAKGGAIVGIIDTSLGKGWENLGVYSASKNALRQNLLSAAVEFAPSVRVNCVCPGAIMLADWEAGSESELVEKIPLGRLGKPEDIASTVLFLAESEYITGQSIYVDGGWSIA